MENPRDCTQWFDKLEGEGYPFWDKSRGDKVQAVEVGIREILEEESESDLLALRQAAVRALGRRTGSVSRYGCSATGGNNSGLEIPVGIRNAIDAILIERRQQAKLGSRLAT